MTCNKLKTDISTCFEIIDDRFRKIKNYLAVQFNRNNKSI